MWLVKFMTISAIKGFDVLIRDEVETLQDDTDNNKYTVVMAALKLYNKMVYTSLILSQE